MNVTELTTNLIRIPSVSGNEAAVASYLETIAKEAGFTTLRIPTEPGRDNILVTTGSPTVLLSTHMDVVPGPEHLFTPRVENGRIIGRGACDAKGIIASMFCAARELKNRGVRDLGMLFVVGEEVGGDGARAASKALANRGITWIINGEPTEGKLMKGHKGAVYCEVHTSGRACHSGYPHLGESAISKLIPVLSDLSECDFGQHPVLGPATLNIARLGGGVAENVLAPAAHATCFIRTVTPVNEVVTTLERVIGTRATIRAIDGVDPVTLQTIDGFETDVAAYCTDIPNFLPLGCDFLLLGPGSIHLAHTDQESIAITELEDAVNYYSSLVQRLT